MSGRSIPQALIDKQHQASDPAVSTWVSANAGAGKTHVLAQRVIRLLLQGTKPEKILCLTFTKAAAANMANRIFDALGAWTALDDDALDAAIRKTGTERVTAKLREKARQLFASALETPGGLKVQTIHGFCTRLLQQFPFEADVPAHFVVLEETQQQQLLEQVRRDVLLKAANAPESDLGRALAAIIPICSDFSFQQALTEAIRKRGSIMRWLESAGGIDSAMAELSVALGIKPTDRLEAVEAAILDGPHLPSREWSSAIDVCAAAKSSKDKGVGSRLQAAHAAGAGERLRAYLQVFFTKDGKERTALLTNGFGEQNPTLHRVLVEEHQRVVSLCEQRRAILSRDRTRALLTLAVDVINRYAAEKNRRGLLDYDDLIGKARDLLQNTDAAWVHYKLDLGIDHILIDEAQDTSPAQWDIITEFVSEFTAGAGARSTVERTVFAVGDEKQSIFSFQGAAPKAFEEKKQFFEKAHRDAGKPFVPVPMLHSFRSVPAVLNAVDWIFKDPLARQGLSADPVETLHTAVRENAPGLVEIWDLIEPEEKKEVEPWDAPFDLETSTSPRVKLARQIATAVKTWRAHGELVGDAADRRPLRAGDILILVRQRGPLFEAIIRQLKNADIPVAGADRLVLTEHIAIMDLLTLADVVLHPRDDLALATILKSPIFGLSEDELLSLASEREGGLRTALRLRQPDLAGRLDAITQSARRCTPFSFYAELLGAGGGRRAFLSRLGHEANDALDEFVNLALDYESRETPSLQGFAAWLRTASAAVKRDMEMARDEVRVMTVHGAKGLEAPVVILADTTTLPAGPPHLNPRLLDLPPQDAPPDKPDRLVWVPTKKEDVGPTVDARDRLVAEAEDEYRRLLYVALTRAADRLIVCGAVGERTMPPGCWYELVGRGLEAGGRLTEEAADFDPRMTVRRYKSEPPPERIGAPVSAPAVADMPPAWLRRAAPVDTAPLPITPSMFYDEDAPPALHATGEGRQKALARGNLVHRLMQSLPDLLPEWRENAARRYLARNAKEFSAAEQEALLGKVLAVLDDKRFAEMFVPGSRAEVPIIGRLGGHPLSGQIDRLVVTPKAVLIGDYKTNNPPPRGLEDVPQGYVKQLALYRAVLGKLYPDRPIRAALIWTEIPEIMEIPASILDAAADGQACLDAPPPRSYVPSR
jgi:ATP-dependent helicase/nuclease subunit A